MARKPKRRHTGKTVGFFLLDDGGLVLFCL